MKLAVAAVAVLLAGCGVRHDAHSAVKLLLNDPDSAQFTDFPQATPDNACGLVNAKNRMGGYVGATPFMYEGASGRATIVQPLDDMDFEQISRGGSTDHFVEVSARCSAALQWKSVCGSEYPGRIHRLCEVMSKDGATIGERLFQEFRR